MTPARKAALQWFHDRGEVYAGDIDTSVVSFAMHDRMLSDGQLQRHRNAPIGMTYTLTDAGRRAMHGDRE